MQKCSVCEAEVQEGSNLCETCTTILGVLFDKYDAKAITTMFTYAIGGQMVTEITRQMTERMQEEYGQEILNQTNMENPQ